MESLCLSQYLGLSIVAHYRFSNSISRDTITQARAAIIQVDFDMALQPDPKYALWGVLVYTDIEAS